MTSKVWFILQPTFHSLTSRVHHETEQSMLDFFTLIICFFLFYLFCHCVQCFLGPTITYSQDLLVSSNKVEEKKFLEEDCQCPCHTSSNLFQDYPQIVILTDPYLPESCKSFSE